MGPFHGLLRLLCLASFSWPTAALLLLHNNTRSGAKNASSQLPTFAKYVESVTSGWGIWKWSNALAAYDRHLVPWKGIQVRLAEVGVWSGGSLLMWPAVLGSQCWVFGLDISKDALNFQAAPNTKIVLLDQGDPKQWEHFFAYTTPNLDVLIDDGGHTSPLMLTTTYSVWPRLSPGGVLAIEDIHGPQYLQSFFQPVAHFYGTQARAELASLHVYPFVLIAEKAAPQKQLYDPSTWQGVHVQLVSTMEQITAALAAAPAGSVVVLENAAWGDFLAASVIWSVFEFFNVLHTPENFSDNPPGCAKTNTPVCTSYATNSPQMNQIYGVHILPTRLVIEVPWTTPSIQAVRHGTSWMKYPTHS